MKIVNNLKIIREFFWPILEPMEGNINPIEVKLEDCEMSETSVDLALKYVEDYKRSEDERKKEVESKATIFIGTFAVAITVLINLAKEYIFSTNISDSFFTTIIILLISLTIIYLCKSIGYSIKALQKRNYSTLGFPSYLFKEDSNKKLRILLDQYNAINRNRNVINEKVDYMTMAQLFFKRAVVVVLMITVSFLGNYIGSRKGILNDCIKLVQQVKLTEWTIILIFSTIFILICFIGRLCYKINKLEKKVNEPNN